MRNIRSTRIECSTDQRNKSPKKKKSENYEENHKIENFPPHFSCQFCIAL